MIQAADIRNLLFDDINNLASHPELFAKNPARDFTRNRKIPAFDTLAFPILMERDSLNRELLKYFGHSLETPSLSAYYQQRRKLLPGALQQLLFAFNSHFRPTLFRDRYILTAVDGSGFNIFHNPEDKDSYYPPKKKSGTGHNEIYVVAAFQTADRIYSDAVIQPSRKKNEYSAICDLVDRCDTRHGIPIFLADRGFPSYNLFAHAREKGVCFLVRAKELYIQRLLGTDMPAGTGEFDITVERIITRSNAKKKRSRPESPELYRYVDANTGFDYIAPGSSEEYSLTLRVARVMVEDGVYEYLVTNLPQEEFSTDDLCILYYIRWKIETSYRELKHVVGAVDFHSKSTEYITHEIWARFLLYNFCSQVTALAVVRKSGTRHTYQLNYTMAIKNCHDFLRQKPTEQPMEIVGLIEKFTLPVRPDRNFARRHRFQVPMKFTYRH